MLTLSFCLFDKSSNLWGGNCDEAVKNDWLSSTCQGTMYFDTPHTTHKYWTQISNWHKCRNYTYVVLDKEGAKTLVNTIMACIDDISQPHTKIKLSQEYLNIIIN